MTATLIGELTLGSSVPGLSATLDTVGLALNDLKGVVDAEIAKITSAQAAIDGLASDLDVAIDDLVTGPLNEFQAAVDAAEAALADLIATPDAGVYISDIIANLDALKGVLEAIPDPQAYLDSQIASMTAGVGGLQTRLDGLASTVTDFTDISGLISDQTAALGAIADALNAASAASVAGVLAYIEQASKLLATGVVVVHFNGATSSFGSDVDGAVSGSSLSPSGNSTGVALLVSDGNPTTLANFKEVFGIA